MVDYRDQFDPHPNIPFEQDTPARGLVGPLFALVVVGVLLIAAFFLSTGAGDIESGTSVTAPVAPEPDAQ